MKSAGSPNPRAALGRSAEQRVASHLAARGWHILGTNYRVGRDEVDVVALDGAVLVVLEVRARARTSVAHPFATITRAKAARLRRAAKGLAARFDHDELRIDVASVVGDVIDILPNAIDFTST